MRRRRSDLQVGAAGGAGRRGADLLPLRATDAELATLNKTVDLRTQSVKVNQSRFDNGDIGEFDLARAKTELATSRAEAIGLQRQRAQFENALAVLLGKPAASFTPPA
jgi:multidrug efflux system outer membrane protein